MALLIDVFGYASVILRGLTMFAQSVELGGALFLLLLTRPLTMRFGCAIISHQEDAARIAAYGAAGLMLSESASVALQTAVLAGTVNLSFINSIGNDSAVAGIVCAAAAARMACLLFAFGGRVRPSPLVALMVIELGAATITTHAFSRLENRIPLMIADGMHQFGAALWIGGIPYFLLALGRVGKGQPCQFVGARFSLMSMAGVACILAGATVMGLFDIGDIQSFYGTTYGVMVAVKISLFLLLLGLRGSNFMFVRRLQKDPDSPITRLKRFAEAEMGIGIAIFFAAASLTSMPPAVDFAMDRVSWQEIIERNTPQWPRLKSPDRDTLALPLLQTRLDAESHEGAARLPTFTPGSGELPPRNANDIAWSEYNHHWAGLFVLSVGLLSLLNQIGVRWARHWPLLLVGLAGFLLLRSDPEAWPLGSIGFFESFRYVEVLQHRAFVLLLCIFAWFEWRVRAGNWRVHSAALVFPILCAGGGTLLLAHSHVIANIKDQMLIELSHTPLAVAGIAAGWARWLELRLDPPLGRAAGWIWPSCLLLVGLILLTYREA